MLAPEGLGARNIFHSTFGQFSHPIFKAQGDKNKLMEKEAPGSFSEGRGDHILYNISLMLSKTNLTYSVVAAVLCYPKKNNFRIILFIIPVSRYLLNESVNSIAFNFDLLRHVTIE